MTSTNNNITDLESVTIYPTSFGIIWKNCSRCNKKTTIAYPLCYKCSRDIKKSKDKNKDE